MKKLLNKSVFQAILLLISGFAMRPSTAAVSVSLWTFQIIPHGFAEEVIQGNQALETGN